MTNRVLKIAHISDTHNRHKRINWGSTDPSQVDVLVCSGDFSGTGNKSEVLDFLKWFSKLPTLYKILVAGNHDRSFDPKFNDGKNKPNWLIGALEEYEEGPLIHYYLENQAIDIEGVTFWGSPQSKWFHGDHWAFNIHEEEAHEFYQQVPESTDVLITHGPALHYGDSTLDGDFAGSLHMGDRITRVKPLLHLFGHIHEDQGYEERTGHQGSLGIHHFNGSICNLRYEPVNAPWFIEADFDERNIKILNYEQKEQHQGPGVESGSGGEASKAE